MLDHPLLERLEQGFSLFGHEDIVRLLSRLISSRVVSIFFPCADPVSWMDFLMVVA